MPPGALVKRVVPQLDYANPNKGENVVEELFASIKPSAVAPPEAPPPLGPPATPEGETSARLAAPPS